MIHTQYPILRARLFYIRCTELRPFFKLLGLRIRRPDFSWFKFFFSCRSQDQIMEGGGGSVWCRPTWKPSANKLWSPVQNEREELVLTSARTDTISKWHWDKETTVKDGKKQGMWTGWFTDRSHSGSRAEAWTVTLQRIMANGIPDSWKKVNSYGNSVFTLNENCPMMPIKNTTGGESFNLIIMLYFSLITHNLEENSSKYFLCCFRYLGSNFVWLLWWQLNKNDVVSLKQHFLLLFPCNFFLQLDILGPI